MHDEETALRVWSLLEMFEWRFLPSQILVEDDLLMSDLLTISWLYALLKQQIGK